MPKAKPPSSDGHQALVNRLAPSHLHWASDHGDIDTHWVRVLRVHTFPQRVSPGWLAGLAALPGVMLSIQAIPASNADVVQQLNRAITGIEGELLNKSSPLMIQQLQSRHRDAQALLKKVGDQEHRVWTVAVFVLIVARDADEGRQRADQVLAQLGAAELRLRPLATTQDLGMRAMLPLTDVPQGITTSIPFQLPSEAVAAMFPFAGGGINHGQGVALGHDSAGGLVLIDRWHYEDNPVVLAAGVANRNWTILGSSGKGKSTTVKTTLIREWAMGHTVIIVDPEREYRQMALKLGGAWINVAGGGQAINPFVVPGDVPADTDDLESDEGLTAITQQQYRVRTLLTFYLPDLTGMQAAILKEAVSGAYATLGITAATDPATVTTWPTMADLHAYVVAHQMAEIPEWAQLAVLLRDVATGIDSRFFQGKHLVAPDADFIVLDTHDVEDLDPGLKRAVLWNALGFAWNLVKKDPDATKILVVDEAWMLIDPTTPQALGFMQNLAKRARKYHCSFTVASQNVIDFLDPAVARQGQTILGNSSFKLLLGLEPNDLAAIAGLFQLTDREQFLLRKAPRGQGLLIAGNQRVWTKIEPTGFELGLMAK